MTNFNNEFQLPETSNPKYCKPILRLADLCSAEGIPFVVRPLFNGLQLVCPELDTWELDVICHDYSYGCDSGLVEIAGAICENDDDTVEGYLDVEEVFERIKKYYKKEDYDNIKGYSTVEEIFEDIRKCYKKRN